MQKVISSSTNSVIAQKALLAQSLNQRPQETGSDLPKDVAILNSGRAMASEPLVDAGRLARLEKTSSARVKDEKFLSKYGPWGVVTGASQGIGLEFAKGLAEKGMDLVLVARKADKLEAVAESLRAEHGVQVRVVAEDLSKPVGLEGVKKATQGLEVGMLVNNAGAWQFGSFLDNDIDRDVSSVALNVEAPMVLSHHFANQMAERGRGGIINVGSGAALHGVPGQAAYSATKGFLKNFSESLYRELKPKGVDVLITNPGPVEGEASQAYDQSKVPLQKVEGRDVVKDAFRRLGHGSSTIPGWLNKVAMGVAVRAMPRDLLTSVAGYILESASPGESKGVAKAAEIQPTKSNSASPKTESLKDSGESTALGAAGAAGGFWSSLVATVSRPVKSLLKGKDFAMDFVGGLRTRAEEISQSPDKVEAHLKARGLHHEYQPPQNNVDLKLEGRMLIKADMAEFFELWDSWISKGYGSINDRQYADLVLKYRDQARELPWLKHVPMTSDDVFSVEMKEGKMTQMKETTTTKLGGVIPTSKVNWLYQRDGDPTASNSFEHTIDRFNGDLQAVQDFYNELFDPKKLNPNSKATVEFTVRQVDSLDQEKESAKPFRHSVEVPLGGILSQPASTI